MTSINPPHFHARYQSHAAVFALDGELITGHLPPTQAALVKAWALLHHDELSANWDLLVDGEPTYRIDPLR
jgi:hypothetical protein